MRQPKPSEPKHLTASQAAALLQVSPKTVSRWAKEGKLPFVRTLGGHRRYPDSEIRALVDRLSERPVNEEGQNPGTRSA
jgi:excisionase family DNA binding protein